MQYAPKPVAPAGFGTGQDDPREVPKRPGLGRHLSRPRWLRPFTQRCDACRQRRQEGRAGSALANYDALMPRGKERPGDRPRRARQVELVSTASFSALLGPDKDQPKDGKTPLRPSRPPPSRCGSRPARKSDWWARSSSPTPTSAIREMLPTGGAADEMEDGDNHHRPGLLGEAPCPSCRRPTRRPWPRW